MSEATLTCPECASEYTYEMGEMTVCSMCAHEWIAGAGEDEQSEPENTEIRDSVGNVLADGDTVTLVKTVTVKGAQGAIKVGTKVRGIRLVGDSGDGHDIDCKIDGFGKMKLKSSIVKKVV